jgi:hypothetical protein
VCIAYPACAAIALPHCGASSHVLCVSCCAGVLQAVQTVPLYGVLSALKLFRPKVQQQQQQQQQQQPAALPSEQQVASCKGAAAHPCCTCSRSSSSRNRSKEVYCNAYLCSPASSFEAAAGKSCNLCCQPCVPNFTVQRACTPHHLTLLVLPLRP